VRALPRRADVLLVDATGRDHPRRAGLALQLGVVLDVPTVRITQIQGFAHTVIRHPVEANSGGEEAPQSVR
jgi:deoxyinosine 3'endonuclease (endonuclease V)